MPSSERELAEGETRESFPIPDQLVGLVIGRGGENIQRVQSQTNCEIQVLPTSDGSNDRPCTLTGAPEAVAEAKKMLQDTIANGQAKDEENRKTPRLPMQRSTPSMRGGGAPRGGMRGAYNGGAPRFSAPNGGGGPPRFNIQGHGYNPYQQTTEDFLVPSDKIGVAIGKGGQNLKNLRTKFNVNLELVQGDTDPPGVAKPLRITGSLGQINATRMDCFTSMLAKEEKTQAKLAPGAQVRSDFPVPQEAVGVIIGKKGETITNLQGETQTRIQFQPEEPGAKTRGCYVTGIAESVMKAQQIVMGICRKKMVNQETKQTFAPPGQMAPPGPPGMNQGAPQGHPPMPHQGQPGQMPWSTPTRPQVCFNMLNNLKLNFIEATIGLSIATESLPPEPRTTDTTNGATSGTSGRSKGRLSRAQQQNRCRYWQGGRAHHWHQEPDWLSNHAEQDQSTEQ